MKKMKKALGKVIYFKSERVTFSDEPFSVPPVQIKERRKNKSFLEFRGN